MPLPCRRSATNATKDLAEEFGKKAGSAKYVFHVLGGAVTDINSLSFFTRRCAGPLSPVEISWATASLLKAGPLATQLVGLSSLLRVGEHFVIFVDLLEALLSLVVTWVDIRLILAGETTESTINFFFISIPVYT
jgi:hypothetical protein